MAIKDKNGCYHDEKNGQFVSKTNNSSSSYIQISPKMMLDFSSVTKREWAMWYHAIGEIKRGIKYPMTKNGYLIQINNKVFVTSGTYEKPQLEKILQFCDSSDADLFIERIYKND